MFHALVGMGGHVLNDCTENHCQYDEPYDLRYVEGEDSAKVRQQVIVRHNSCDESRNAASFKVLPEAMR